MPNICVLRSIDLFSIHIWMPHHLSYNLKGNPDVCKSNPMYYIPLENAGYQVWCCSSQILELISPETRRNIFLHWQRCKNGEDCMVFLKNIFIFFKYFNYACVCACAYMHISAGTYRGQKRCWIPWSWSYSLVWMLGSKLDPQQEQPAVLTTGLLSSRTVVWLGFIFLFFYV